MKADNAIVIYYVYIVCCTRYIESIYKSWGKMLAACSTHKTSKKDFVRVTDLDLFCIYLESIERKTNTIIVVLYK